MKNTMYDLTQNWQDRDFIINPFFQDAPFLAAMPMKETNAKLANVTTTVKDIEVPKIIEFDAPLPDIRASFEKTFAVLGKVGGKMPIGLDKIKLLEGGLQAYIDAQMEPIMNKTGQDFDRSFLYAVVKAFCLDHADTCISKVLTGQTADTGFFSMVGISMKRGENCGLYSPALNANGQGKLFEVIVPYNGAVMKVKNEKGEEIYGKEVAVQTYLGMQLPRKDRVHILANISKTADGGIPTPDQVLDFIATFQTGDPENDMIFAHPSIINAIRAKYMRDNQHVEFIRYENGALYFDTVRVIPDKNMLNGTEAAIAD
jgi:hypothetical protein